MRPTTAIILDERTPVKSHGGKFSVKLRVTFKVGTKFKVVYYPLKVYLGKKEFAQVRKSPQNKLQKDLNDELLVIENRAWKAANKAKDQASFESLYFGASDHTLKSYFDRRVIDLKRQGRFGTANIATAAANSFLSFRPGAYITDVDPSWLQLYEQWMIEKGKSYTTVGINLRELRRVLNLAINTGEFDPDSYPFKHYSIKSDRKLKIPVSDADIEKLKACEGKAVSMWLFSYYCNGMNLADIISLTWKHIQGDYIVFNRQKTRRTTTIRRDIVISIRPEVRAIIEKYGNPEGKYIFDYIEGMTDEEAVTAKKRANKLINAQMKSIAAKLGIKTKLTIGIARHSFSNKLLQAGIGKEFIQYALGHGDMKTTENYLSGFRMDQIKKVSELL